MSAISFFPLPVTSTLLTDFFHRPPRLQSTAPPFPSPSLHVRRRNTLIRRAIPKDPKESLFLDEDGVVEDMDGYLNQLSLEYDSVWDTKPSWCQPWTITLTGLVIVLGSWIVLHSVLMTGIVMFLVCTWWYIFLYAYPKEYSNMIEERRKMVTTGAEDTFGRKKI